VGSVADKGVLGRFLFEYLFSPANYNSTKAAFSHLSRGTHTLLGPLQFTFWVCHSLSPWSYVPAHLGLLQQIHLQLNVVIVTVAVVIIFMSSPSPSLKIDGNVSVL
jgi:hypothetical protein